MADIEHRVKAGQAVYSPLVLKIYDAWVLGVSNRCLWRCPTRHLEALYDRNVSQTHVDVGVGTGYFLDRARFPDDPHITLVDLNENSLIAASSRIARYSPAILKANALEPLPLRGGFQSAGLCYLLHCLPGSIDEKARVFDHVSAVLVPGGRIFGATIVQGDAPRSGAARALMDVYNRKGVFSNARDTVPLLKLALDARFDDVRIETIGCVALFEAKKPA